MHRHGPEPCLWGRNSLQEGGHDALSPVPGMVSSFVRRTQAMPKEPLDRLRTGLVASRWPSPESYRSGAWRSGQDSNLHTLSGYYRFSKPGPYQLRLTAPDCSSFRAVTGLPRCGVCRFSNQKRLSHVLFPLTPCGSIHLSARAPCRPFSWSSSTGRASVISSVSLPQA